MTIEPFHIDPNHLDTGCSWEGQLDGGTDLDSQQSLLFRVCKRCYFDQESNLPPDILELWQFSQNFFHRRVSLSWIFSFFSSFDCLDLKTSYIGFGLWKLPTLENQPYSNRLKKEKNENLWKGPRALAFEGHAHCSGHNSCDAVKEMCGFSFLKICSLFSHFDVAFDMFNFIFSS